LVVYRGGRLLQRSIASLLILLAAGCAREHQSSRVAEASVNELLAAASAAVDRGDFEYAIAAYEAAMPQLAKAGDNAGEVHAAVRLGAAQMTIGRYDLAVPTLTRALDEARESGDMPRQIDALNALGAAYTFNPRAGEMPGASDPHSGHHHSAATNPLSSHDPEILLNEARRLAKEAGDAGRCALVLNNLGNYYARTFNQYDKAEEAYTEAAKVVGGSDRLLTSQATVNAAVAAMTAFEFESEAAARAARRALAIELNDKGRELAAGLVDSHQKAFLLITIGQTAEQIARLDPSTAQSQRKIARQVYQQAVVIADALGDLRSRSYACGYLGGLALEDNQLDQAEQLTRRAILAAQQARLPDSLYRWEWQNARLLRARWKQDQSDQSLDASIKFYAAATQPVQFIRNDISLGHGNQRKPVSFRESIGSLYFEYADMLLRRADRTTDNAALGDREKAAAVAALYIKAQETVEQVKAVELENYFQDQCVHLLKSKQKEVQDVDAATAVVYLIPLADRTEILVSFRDKQFFRAASTINAARLKRLAELLRSQISDIDQADEFEPYQTTAQLLYKELIAPIRAALDRRHIQTLVFVPDGALRAIPMAVLFDGQHHLIEDFAIAITPGLELLEPKSIQRASVQLLTSGLSEARDGFKPLTYVGDELKAVGHSYPNGTTLQDKDFIKPRLEQAMEARPYSIVHIASHAVFGDDASKSFLLTYDGRMQLDDIERLIRPYQLRDNPVELLTLSACQSAKGDQERAALGIAGIAVKAGARSALAALWSVDEQATLELMSDFYAELSRGNSTDGKLQVSKAQAMRAAQIKMLRGQRFNHPYHWAGFLIIGNWL
jgi:CHAT domain-containing protein/DNA-binding MarR family transcriptional regulator